MKRGGRRRALTFEILLIEYTHTHTHTYSRVLETGLIDFLRVFIPVCCCMSIISCVTIEHNNAPGTEYVVVTNVFEVFLTELKFL
jgi:hypothetical protein